MVRDRAADTSENYSVEFIESIAEDLDSAIAAAESRSDESDSIVTEAKQYLVGAVAMIREFLKSTENPSEDVIVRLIDSLGGFELLEQAQYTCLQSKPQETPDESVTNQWSRIYRKLMDGQSEN
ncbi:MAG: hypothetical protein CMB80_00640 [Flammeovirgaceae bacterium]|nr:hypothetical protein [Flammeovirgaceae bacterium]|tara:strand:+ start:6398 stop:6769 length:372 start_codon:yes stop_codon:yes gene_type:complete